MREPNSVPKQGTATYQRLLHNRSFVALWLGQTISFIGDYFNWLAIPILVERMTGSSLMVGLVLIFQTLPMLLLGPVAGVFVDRCDRKQTMVVADVLRALLVLPCLLVRTADQIWIYYLVGFLMSCVSRFFFPAQNAALPLIVSDKDDLLAANGLMQIVQTVGMLAGPALAGLTIGMWGERAAFSVDSLTFFISAAAILTMTVPRTAPGRRAVNASPRSKAEGEGQASAVWAEMREGIAYLFGNRTMVGVLVCTAVLQLAIGAIQVLWVPFLQREFGVGAKGLAMVDAIQGVGMVLSGLALGLLTSRWSQTALISWGIVGVGLALLGMGLSPSFAYVMAFSFIIGLMVVPVMSVLATMMQLAVPDSKLGRVGSALNALTTVTTLLSMAGAAALGEIISLRALYVISDHHSVGRAGLVCIARTRVKAPYYAYRTNRPTIHLDVDRMANI
jgi:DHA3 family macrolide efflux protein-like MFS transporter